MNTTTEKANEIRKGLGRFIREQRKKRKTTLESLSERVNCDHSSLSRIERGEQGMSVELTVALARELDVRLCEMYAAAEGMTEGEMELLRAYRNASETGKRMIMAMAIGAEKIAEDEGTPLFSQKKTATQ